MGQRMQKQKQKRQPTPFIEVVARKLIAVCAAVVFSAIFLFWLVMQIALFTQCEFFGLFHICTLN